MGTCTTMFAALLAIFPACAPMNDSAQDSVAPDEAVASGALATGAGSRPCRPLGARCADVQVVAHQDDDLLFMNPDVASSIALGNQVTTIFLTAGAATADNAAHLTAGREMGILNAYTYMVAPEAAAAGAYDGAALLAHWTLHGGAPIQVSTRDGVRQVIQYDFADPLPSGGTISLVFLRLFETNGVVDMRALWDNDVPAVPTVACETPECPLGSVLPEQSYTRDQLIDVVQGLMSRFHAAAGEVPLRLSTLDATGINITREDFGESGWVDNADHIATAQFTVTAFIRYHTAPSVAARSLRQYRGYSIGDEPINLDTSLQGLVKRRIYYRYAIMQDPPPDPTDPDDPHFIAFEGFTNRNYASITIANAATLQGRLESAAGECLIVTAGASATGACSGAAEWQVTPNGEIRLASDPTRCLMLGPPGHDMAGLDSCHGSADAERQTLILTSNGQIRSRDAGCLSGTNLGVQATACAGSADADAHPLRRPVASQDWTLLFGEPRLLSLQFSDASEVGTDRSYYRTLVVTDGQICLRRPSGPGCAPYRTGPGTAPLDGTLDPFALLPSQPPEYTDAAGWRDDSTGGTLLFGRLSRSGPLDVCGSGFFGIRCGLGANATWWSTAFSTQNGRASSPSYYGSLRLADVDGDGHSDICGRSSDGIACGTGTGAAFSDPAGMTLQFSDAAGWNASGYGDTIQFADLDGDGRDDVCGRGADGMLCAVSDGATFIHDHVWSFNAGNDSTTNTHDFGDGDPASAWSATPAKYRSIRLVDINRDGLADVCGRGSGGIWCALSTGTAFEAKRTVISTIFTDGEGWNDERYGSTVSFGRLDDDDRIDLCARGSAGIWCSAGL